MTTSRTVRGTFEVVIPGAQREDAPGNIHTDQVAAKYGFRGALVLAVSVYGSSMPIILDQVGDEWARSGWIDIRFRKPVYEGEIISVALDETGEGQWRLALSRDEDDIVTLADLGLGTGEWTEGFHRSASRTPEPPSANQPTLRLETAPVGQDLPTLDMGVPSLDVDGPGRAQVAHVEGRDLLSPATIVGTLSAYSRRVFQYESPSLHAGSHVQHLGLVEVGEALTVAGHLSAAYERRGHHYAEYDGVVMGADGRDVALVRHTVVFKIGTANR